MPVQQPRSWRSSARRGSLSVVLWAFGLTTTLLLVGLWGRAVTHDQPTVEASARSVVDAEVASDRIYGWIEAGLEQSANIDQPTAEAVVFELRTHPEIEVAVDGVVDEFVALLFAANIENSQLELTDSLGPVLPLVADELSEHDVAIEAEQLADVLAEAEAVDLAAGEAAAVARIVDDARAVLSLVVVLTGVALALLGSAAVGLADDRPAMVRTLATRIVLSALSFAVLFRVGSWVLDPSGGASPVAGSGSILLNSNGHVFLIAASAGASLAVGFGLYVRRRQRIVARAAEDALHDTDTRELVSV